LKATRRLGAVFTVAPAAQPTLRSSQRALPHWRVRLGPRRRLDGKSNVATTPPTVQISDDGGTAMSVTANLSRPDVAADYPSYGPYHGYDVSVPSSATAQSVCGDARRRRGRHDHAPGYPLGGLLRRDGDHLRHRRRQTADSNLDELNQMTHTDDTVCSKAPPSAVRSS
jgi:hypothetical protein